MKEISEREMGQATSGTRNEDTGQSIQEWTRQPLKNLRQPLKNLK